MCDSGGACNQVLRTVVLQSRKTATSLKEKKHKWRTFTIKKQLEIPSARSWAAPVRATGMVQKRQAVWPVHHVQNHTCRVTMQG